VSFRAGIRYDSRRSKFLSTWWFREDQLIHEGIVSLDEKAIVYFLVAGRHGDRPLRKEGETPCRDCVMA